MESNSFELIGRVNYVNLKSLSNGNSLTRVLLSIKRYKSEEYDTFPITFFAEVSQDAANRLKKGDYINVVGRLNLDKFKNKEGKDVESISLIGYSFIKVTFDKDQKRFVEVEDNAVAPKSEQLNMVEELLG
jgi:single-stranded DNA-binding protein